jgi:hypothetical protein
MYYCGLDVSRKSTHVHIEDGQGNTDSRDLTKAGAGKLTLPATFKEAQEQ